MTLNNSWNRQLLLALVFVFLGTLASADSLLQAALEKDLKVDMDEPIQLGAPSLAEKLGRVRCEYYLSKVDSVLAAISDGASPDDIRKWNADLNEPNFLVDYIERQENFRNAGASAVVKSEIILSVREACEMAVGNLLANR